MTIRSGQVRYCEADNQYYRVAGRARIEGFWMIRVMNKEGDFVSFKSKSAADISKDIQQLHPAHRADYGVLAVPSTFDPRNKK